MADLGEKGFLRRLLDQIPTDPRIEHGLGHDAAIVRTASGSAIVLKIDRGPTSIARTLGWADHRSTGRLAVAAACSDLLAVGARPLAFMLAVAVPRETLASDVALIVDGALDACKEGGVAYAGGDTKESPFSVVGCAVGELTGHNFLTRASARPGDELLIVGEVGAFSAALYRLLDEDDPHRRSRRCLQIVARQSPQWLASELTARVDGLRGGMDASDGLFECLVRLGGGLGFRLDIDAVPFHPLAIEVSNDLSIPLVNLFCGGSDWNIAYVAEAGRAELAVEVGAELGLTVRRVGVYTEDRAGIDVHASGSPLGELTGTVSEHFGTRIEDVHEYYERLRTERFIVESP